MRYNARHDRLLARSRAFVPSLLLACAALSSACADESPVRARVGVLLPLSGPTDRGALRSIELGRDLLAEAGGPELELELVDTAREGFAEGAARLLADPSITAVIGPASSVEALEVGHDFVAARRPLVLPSASSAELFHAFATDGVDVARGTGVVWRTVQSDVAQLRVLLRVAQREGHRRVALVSSIDGYGATFFDWFGFLATEDDLVPTIAVRAPLAGGGCEDAVRRALASEPDALIAVPADDAGLRCVVEAARAQAPAVQLLLPDVGRLDALRTMPAAQGVLGTDPGADPDGGFDVLHRARFDEEPGAYAAATVDAVLLVGYGLERSRGRGDAALVDALSDLARPIGVGPPWSSSTVGDTLRAARRGELGPLSTASGSPDYDPELLMDPTRSTYRVWRIRDGAFQTLDHVTVDEARSISRSTATPARLLDVTEVEPTGYVPAPRTGLYALLVATSRGFDSYRHQADALGQYQMLRAHGVPDDRIVLVIADDLADHPANLAPGTVRNRVGGPDVRAGATIDHRLSDVDATILADILRGAPSVAGPVIEAGPGDDVYVFLVGHAGREGLYVGGDEPSDGVQADSTLLTHEMIGAAVRERFARGGYRRLLIAIEACHGEALGDRLDSPGALLLSGAARHESSLAAGRDPALGGVWVTDQFASVLTALAAEDPSRSLAALYREAYLRVPGSHVTVVNPRRFGRLGDVPLSDFVTP